MSATTELFQALLDATLDIESRLATCRGLQGRIETIARKLKELKSPQTASEEIKVAYLELAAAHESTSADFMTFFADLDAAKRRRSALVMSALPALNYLAFCDTLECEAAAAPASTDIKSHQ